MEVMNNMPDERTLKQKHKAALAAIEKLWKSREINFGEARNLIAHADTAYELAKVHASDEKLINPVYVRNVACGVCKGKVTARRIINGWIITCDCGEVFNSDFHAEDNKLWKRRYG